MCQNSINHDKTAYIVNLLRGSKFGIRSNLSSIIPHDMQFCHTCLSAVSATNMMHGSKLFQILNNHNLECGQNFWPTFLLQIVLAGTSALQGVNAWTKTEV